jgi:hypothetical protein
MPGNAACDYIVERGRYHARQALGPLGTDAIQ